MSWVDIVRKVTFGFTLFCALIALAMGGSVISVTGDKKHFDPPQTLSSSAMAIAIGVLTMVTLLPMLIVDIFRTGAFTSMILVEQIWLNLLWVLWLTVGALGASDVTGFYEGQCSTWSPAAVASSCDETQAVAAFGFLACFALTGYTSLIMVFAIIRHSRGVPIWRTSVKEAFAPGLQQYSSQSKFVETPDTQYQYPPSGPASVPSPAQGYPQV
ncbi:hypothetical protein CERSUDRAFT_111068 [Gelatoporia subvermispora B]|uniref:MARVEL domain-containing protein n=1 Tax=Ceriporiopsis subvermispora (strain B) TaxID=914234 RepID=M2R7T5_CERS8|nr:hypothetical protein CERSUDRAFT_111068 [Gelatoporia subvermispora B]